MLTVVHKKHVKHSLQRLKEEVNKLAKIPKKMMKSKKYLLIYKNEQKLDKMGNYYAKKTKTGK